MPSLLLHLSWPEFRHQAWRHLVALLAIALGVALAFSVHLINGAALTEFTSAVRAINGQADLQLRARQGLLDEAWLARLQHHPSVVRAGPVLELNTQAEDHQGVRHPVRLWGVDALALPELAPALMPQTQRESRPSQAAKPTNETDGPDQAGRRFDLFAPDAVFLNPSAAWLLFGATAPAQAPLRLFDGSNTHTLRVAGRVTAPGEALLVMDIAALQDLMDHGGQLSRIDLRLGSDIPVEAFLAGLDLPPQLLTERPEQAAERSSNLSRAYRVNLSVLALVALFTGGFLVFSVLSLSVMRRQQGFALLGVLGLSGGERMRLVLSEAALLGLVGSLLGLLLGTGLASLALGLLGGDLGGGYFGQQAPSLRWDSGPAALCVLLGTVAAVAGAWWPARAVQALAPAAALKGLGSPEASAQAARHWAWTCLGLAALLAWLPAIGGLPLAAYASVGLLLLGGIGVLPQLVAPLLDRWAGRNQGCALALLALERARHQRNSAAVATSGVVASLALSVALTVMVSSFRDSVSHWLDQLLPAQLYVRNLQQGPLPPTWIEALRQLPELQRMEQMHSSEWRLDPSRPPVALLARELAWQDGSPMNLPLVGPLHPAPAGAEVVPVFVSEAMVDLYRAQPGTWLERLGDAYAGGAQGRRFWVAGVWRDYARQQGSVVLERRHHTALSGDASVTDLALFASGGAGDAVDRLRLAVQASADAAGLGAGLRLSSADEIRQRSLQIFDRSFAVTVWLQAVAIGIGLFGVAASQSAQVLARRREFGLLAHLGLRRRDILQLVGLEGLLWSALASLAGLLLGLAVSLILVHVVNPQSFHWRMEMSLPWDRLLLLCGAVVLAGAATSWIAGRAAAARDAVQSVKEDW